MLSLLFTILIRQVATNYYIVDRPQSAERKVHKKPTPLLGGMAIFLAMFLMIFIVRYFGLANFSLVPDKFIWGVFVGASLIILGGFLDDKYNLKPSRQIIWPILAVLAVLISGIRIGYVTNPIGDSSNAIIYLTSTVGIIISFVWLMVMMYTTKFLDGLDGLASGIGAIAGIVIFLLSLSWDVEMSATGVWALVFAGATLGFLILNWYPAKIFLGEGGSLLIGYILGVLSIISGSKIAATLLVVGIPALDVFWVIIQRLIKGQSPFAHADNKHLHYQLLTLGFSHQGAVLFLCFISLIFGAIAIIANGIGKLIGLLAMTIIMIVLIFIITFSSKKVVKNKT